MSLSWQEFGQSRENPTICAAFEGRIDGLHCRATRVLSAILTVRHGQPHFVRPNFATRAVDAVAFCGNVVNTISPCLKKDAMDYCHN